MTDLNFSIIIPHYNIPHLLQRCLDSIPRRDDLFYTLPLYLQIELK